MKEKTDQRLLRLSKMLRLARMKRILNKYENLAKVQEYGNIGMVLLVIFAAAHVMTCFWYLSGTVDEEVQGEVRLGWVNAEWDGPGVPEGEDPLDPEWEGGWAADPGVSLMDRYTGSIYRVFNVVEFSNTKFERRLSVFYHVLLLMVDGAVAGVMSGRFFPSFSAIFKRKIQKLPLFSCI